MGVILVDLEKDDNDLSLSFWHWRSIVEAIGRLGVVPEERVKALHQLYSGNGLSREEAMKVAVAIRERVLPTLGASERLLLDGSKTAVPDDGVMHYKDQEKNYSTNAAVLREFAEFCAACKGFKVC